LSLTLVLCAVPTDGASTAPPSALIVSLAGRASLCAAVAERRSGLHRGTDDETPCETAENRAAATCCQKQKQRSHEDRAARPPPGRDMTRTRKPTGWRTRSRTHVPSRVFPVCRHMFFHWQTPRPGAP